MISNCPRCSRAWVPPNGYIEMVRGEPLCPICILADHASDPALPLDADRLHVTFTDICQEACEKGCYSVEHRHRFIASEFARRIAAALLSPVALEAGARAAYEALEVHGRRRLFQNASQPTEIAAFRAGVEAAMRAVGGGSAAPDQPKPSNAPPDVLLGLVTDCVAIARSEIKQCAHWLDNADKEIARTLAAIKDGAT